MGEQKQVLKDDDRRQKTKRKAKKDAFTFGSVLNPQLPNTFSTPELLISRRNNRTDLL